MVVVEGNGTGRGQNKIINRNPADKTIDTQNLSSYCRKQKCHDTLRSHTMVGKKKTIIETPMTRVALLAELVNVARKIVPHGLTRR